VCSALKQTYRDKIREDNNNVVFLHLHADKGIIAQRMQNREGHFMPLSLLDSQFATLEMPSSQEPNTHQIDITGSISDVVKQCVSVSKAYLS
jgi:gluconokinase